jgi:quercetin dioxygenase-like cupin family protein
MNLQALHSENKPLQTKIVFTGSEGKVISIQLEKEAILKEHITKTPAFLLCVVGQVLFENELGVSTTIRNGDYIHIDAEVKHWLIAKENSNLVLIK